MKTMIMTFGRFNIPHFGHKKVMDKIKSLSKGRWFFSKKTEHIVVLSRTENKDNPFNFGFKKDMFERAFPGMNLCTDSKLRTPFQVFEKLSAEGYTNLILVVGGDRVEEFKIKIQNQINKGNLKFEKFKVVSAGSRDTEGMSSSLMREYVRGDLKTSFIGNSPLLKEDSENLFRILRGIYK